MIDQEEIHNLCLSKDPKKCIEAIGQLQNNFSLLSDKQQAWNDLHRLITYKVSRVRSNAVSALVAVFSDMSDKQQAWSDLVRLTSDKDSNVRYWVTSALGSVFSDVPHKQLAWIDLFSLTFDNDHSVRSSASFVLKVVFSDVPDKQLAWKDLVRLISYRDSDVNSSTTSIFGSIFSQVPDKQQAWNDLVRPTSNQDRFVKYSVISIFGSVFSDVPDKQLAWNDLHRLTFDDDLSVRSRVASVLGSIFSQVPDKQQAWSDLVRLTSDKDSSVKIYANHSLGKVSIIKASLTGNDKDYKKELEKAIGFFEIAAKESSYNNPAQFCLPFYRSFYTIVFKKQEAKKEVNKYLVEAEYAVRGSKSKELLFEAVSNLANALMEVQNLENLDLEAKKCELNFYRKYCDRASELMRDTEETVPFATMAMRKGLPILDRNLKKLLEEIQRKTELISEQTKGTQFEQLGDELNQSSQFILQVRDPVGFQKQVNIMQNTLKAICSKFPEGQKGEACELLKMMDAEPSIEDKIPLMVNILSKFSYQLDITVHLNRIEEKLDQKLNCISYDIFKIKLNSYNVISNLDAMKKELKKLNEIEGLNESLITKLDSFQAEKLNELNKNILERLDEIRILIECLPNNDDTQKIIDSLKELKQSDSDILLQRSSAVISLIGFIMQILPQVLTHKPV